jgi:hypothetical protein
VKRVRVWLLVLLAALLPVRGAMAGALLCPPESAATSSAASATHHHVATHGDAQAHDHAQPVHAAGGHHDHAGQLQQDKCNLCSAFCSLTPLLSAVPGVVLPRDLAYALLPELGAPVARFLSDGQERPPRSI